MTESKQLQAAASSATKPRVAAREPGCPPFNARKETTISPQAGLVLVQEIAPRLRSAIPGVRKVGAEDDEELLQDGLTMAAQMLRNLEGRGKSVTPGNVAYYCLLHLKSGRRSYSGGRTDVMGSATQLDHSSMVLSFEEEVGFDPELGEPITLGELLTTEDDDPATRAGRNLDWNEFMDTHDQRFEAILDATACGQTMEPVARRYGCSLSTISSLKRRLSEELQESFGVDILTEVARRPKWHSSIQVEREKVASRPDAAAIPVLLPHPLILLLPYCQRIDTTLAGRRAQIRNRMLPYRNHLMIDERAEQSLQAAALNDDAMGREL